ncbi:hypothetical protein HYS28_02525 [Candidatus Uhrbacteria bacterium]|nr:hypothetical protein [Candidatus Uhrbacteria bacterium]
MAEAKKRAPVRRAKKSVQPMPMNDVHGSVARQNVCHACNSLPAGSIELTALMLVLVFSLSAVLFTSVYALQSKGAEVAQLEAQVAALEAGIE